MDLRRSEPRGDSGGSGWRKEALKTGGMIHNITEKRRERSSLRAANESRFTRSNMDEYGIARVRLCVMWIARIYTVQADDLANDTLRTMTDVQFH